MEAGADRLKNDPVPEVTTDVFERGSGVPVALHRLGARVTVEPLAAGDYRVGGGVLIERKTVADLHGSLGRGRLWEQVGKIRDEAVSPFLLIEGDQLAWRSSGVAIRPTRPSGSTGSRSDTHERRALARDPARRTSSMSPVSMSWLQCPASPLRPLARY
jgi:hypothetical protein